MAAPEDSDPPAGQSIWARLERQDRQEAERAKGPLSLMWMGILLVNAPTLARVVGFEDLPTGVLAAFVVIGLALAVAGFVLLRSVRRKTG